MTNKELLYFVAKCLTISVDYNNKLAIKKLLETTKIDWDNVVRYSTSNSVFTTLYCNLKYAKLLDNLPDELVAYMQYITNVNRYRNDEIVKQAREINELLLFNNIKPVFLKGTANLLAGLYADTGARMVDAIDFIVATEDFENALYILKKNKYSSNVRQKNRLLPLELNTSFKKENEIATVKVHKALVLKKYTKQFNYAYVNMDTQLFAGAEVMSYKNQFCMSIIDVQINNNGFCKKTMALQDAYDILLLSRKIITESAFNDFSSLKNPLNCFVAICYEVFNAPLYLNYKISNKTERYLRIFKKLLAHKQYRDTYHRKIRVKQYFNVRFKILFKSLFLSTYRNWLWTRIRNNNR